MSEQFININLVNQKYKIDNLPADTHTTDDTLKYKLRSLNLIKYNPELFTNRGNFYDFIGGNRGVATVLLSGLGMMAYRKRLNTLRGVAKREGIWFSNINFLFGCSIGMGYNMLFFMPIQRNLNDYYAHYLMARYNGSNDIRNNNIYTMKDRENTDTTYNYSKSYFNTYHM